MFCHMSLTFIFVHADSLFRLIVLSPLQFFFSQPSSPKSIILDTWEVTSLVALHISTVKQHRPIVIIFDILYHMESRTCHLIANRIFVHVYRKITIYVTPFLSSQGLASNIAGVEQDTHKHKHKTVQHK